MKFMACRHCGTVTTQPVCERCAGPERAAKERARGRPNRQARGYDADYDAARRAIAARLAGGPAPATEPARRRPARQGASQAVRRSQGAGRANPPKPGHTAQTGANRDGADVRGETGANRGESDIPCVICGLPISAGQSWSVEHVKALRHGGTNEPANLGPAHSACNYGWRRSPGRL